MYSASLDHPIILTGRGIFSGQSCRAVVYPALSEQGIHFSIFRETVPLDVGHYVEHPNCSLLAKGGARVAVIEHLLAALWAAGIDSATIDVTGAELPGTDAVELPNVDGSALPQYRALLACGRREFGERRTLKLRKKLRVDGPDGEYLQIKPAAELSVEYTFDHPELGSQHIDLPLDRESAAREVLPARSFITAREVELAMQAGFLRNENEEDALLIRDGVPAQPLRFPDEYARHKVLDMLGDLYAVPFELTGRITGYKSGHRLNRAMARLLVESAPKRR